MYHWIIALTMPSGNKYAFSTIKGMFALVPIEHLGSVKNALVWPTKEDAENHLKNQLEIAPNIEDMGEIEIIEMTEGH